MAVAVRNALLARQRESSAAAAPRAAGEGPRKSVAGPVPADQQGGGLCGNYAKTFEGRKTSEKIPPSAGRQ